MVDRAVLGGPQRVELEGAAEGVAVAEGVRGRDDDVAEQRPQQQCCAEDHCTMSVLPGEVAGGLVAQVGGEPMDGQAHGVGHGLRVVPHRRRDHRRVAGLDAVDGDQPGDRRFGAVEAGDQRRQRVDAAGEQQPDVVTGGEPWLLDTRRHHGWPPAPPPVEQLCRRAATLQLDGRHGCLDGEVFAEERREQQRRRYEGARAGVEHAEVVERGGEPPGALLAGVLHLTAHASRRGTDFQV